jgi:ABC-type transporter Mla subunit MlaD
MDTEQFLRTQSNRLKREDVVQLLAIGAEFEFASDELQAEVDDLNAEVAKVNADHCACCKTIDDALANLAKAPDAGELRKAVGQRADNTLNDVQRIAQLWNRKLDLFQRYAAEIEQTAETAEAAATAKRDEVLRALAQMGFTVDAPQETEGVNWKLFAESRHPEARALHERAENLKSIRQGMPRRVKAEKECAAHAEHYVRTVAERYVAGKL